MVVVPEMLAVGNADTFTITLPICDWLQTGVPDDVTLTKT